MTVLRFRYNGMIYWNDCSGFGLFMTYPAHTLGTFVADLMRRQQHTNVSLAASAGVSEGVIRNLLKVGMDSKAKDPDPRTLRRVADALGIDSLMLFRLAGYIPPAPDANSVRAEYLADVFDALSVEKQGMVLRVLEAMTDHEIERRTIQAMQTNNAHPLTGFDLNAPGLLRLLANSLIAQYSMTTVDDLKQIQPDTPILHYTWKSLPTSTQERIKALIRHKLSLDYDPTMVEPEWRT